MSRHQRIIETLNSALTPVFLNIENESHTHNVPEGSETHFKLVMIATAFEGLNRVKRQQLVMSHLKTEFESGLHALTMRLRTPKEAEFDSAEFSSPDCLGGKKSSNR